MAMVLLDFVVVDTVFCKTHAEPTAAFNP